MSADTMTMDQEGVMSDDGHWRKVLAADLGIFNVAIFFFAYLPPSTLVVPEILAMVGAVLSLVWVVAHATRRVHLPGEQWAYLLTGFLGVLVLLGYLTMPSEAPVAYRVSTSLFLFSGVASAYAAHLIDGGRRGHV